MVVTTELAPRPVSPPARAHRAASRRNRKLGTNLTAYALLAGGVLCFALFSWYPTIRAFLLAFQRTNFVGASHWVGLTNFHRLFADPEFVDAWRNSFEFTGVALVLGFGVPFVLAVVLNELRHWKTVFRLLVYLPVMIPPAVVAILWKWFYDPGNGLFNQALSAVPNILQRVRHVTVPQTRYVMLMLLLLQIVATMQEFTTPFIMTGGGPQDATVTVLYLIYKYAFVYFDYGTACALSIMLFIFLGIFSALYLRLTRNAD